MKTLLYLISKKMRKCQASELRYFTHFATLAFLLFITTYSLNANCIAGEVFKDDNLNTIKDGGEIGFLNAEIDLLDANGAVVQTIFSGANGEYAFCDLDPGFYTVRILNTHPTGFFTQPYGQNDQDVTAGFGPIGEIGPLEIIDTDITGLSAAVSNDYCISGIFIQDVNSDAQFTNFDLGIPQANSRVELRDLNGTLLQVRFTNNFGQYELCYIEPGDYQVVFVKDPNDVFTNNNPDLISVNGDEGTTAVITITNEDIDDVDAFYNVQNCLTGSMFVDDDGDGIYDFNENGVPGQPVELVSPTGLVVDAGVTDANGDYELCGVSGGQYVVRFVKPSNLNYSTPLGQGGQDIVTSFGDVGQTGFVSPSQNTIGVDAVLNDMVTTPPPPPEEYCINGTLFDDLNSNTFFEGNEAGFAGQQINLSQGGSVVNTVTTDANGEYEFCGLVAGAYSLSLVIPQGYFISKPFAQNDQSITNETSGFGTQSTSGIASVFINDGDITDFDLAIYDGSCISGTVFNDANVNSSFEGTEVGIGGQEVRLLNAKGFVLEVTYTDQNGDYEFCDLENSTYRVGFVKSPYLLFSPLGTNDQSITNAVGNLGTTALITVDGDVVDLDAGVYGDDEDPEAGCSANLTQNIAPGLCGAQVFYDLPPSLDNTFGVTSLSNPPSGSFFEVGTTTVTVNAVDVIGNQAACSFTITILPVIGNYTETICQGTTTVINGEALGVGTYTQNIVTPEGCDSIVNVEIFEYASFDVDPGIYEAVCEASGLVALGGTPANGVWSGNGVIDNGDGTYSFDPTGLVGINTLTYEVTDANGCTGSSSTPNTTDIEVTEGEAVNTCSGGDISGFIYMGEFNGSNYYCSSSSHFTWHEANTASQNAGGYLVVINDAAENEYIRSHIMANNAWIGYTDEASESIFVWANGESNGYENWQSGEPNNYNGNDHYTRIRKNSGEWTDRPYWMEYEFVMEIPCSSEIVCVPVCDVVDNDEIEDAQTLTVDGDCAEACSDNASNSTWPGNYGIYCGTANPQNDVWYTASIPSSGALEITVEEESMQDALIAAYYYYCGELYFLGLSDDGDFGVTGPAGYDIYFRIWGDNYNSGSFTVCAVDGQVVCKSCEANRSFTLEEAIENNTGLEILGESEAFSNLQTIETRDLFQISKLYPNPTTTKLNIELLSQSNIMVQVSIVDAAGRVFIVENSTVVRGNNILTINSHNLSGGIYQVIVTDIDETHSETKSFVRR